jgi:hypothetical protein
MGWLPPATPLNFSTWAIVGLTFNLWIRRRWKGWWMKYNYITAAGLDVGLILCTLVIFFAFTLPGVSVPQWWGNVKVFETMVSSNLLLEGLVSTRKILTPFL